MKIGICTGLENISKAEAMGFDYIEWGVSKVASLTEEEFAAALQEVEKSSIRCEAFNVFFPGDMKLVGPEVDKEKINAYIEKAVGRIAALGAKAVVVGSGGARRVPEGWSKETALDQFAEVLGEIGKEAEKYGVTITIEPLNTRETNIVNSVREGLALVEKVNHPHVKLLADFYHMRMENEDMESIVEAGGYIQHTHIANGNGRFYPLNKTEDDYTGFFTALKKIGYEQRVSIEAKTEDFDKDAPAALKILRELSK